MIKIEMLDLDGNVTEVCEATAEERAENDDDPGAFCEDGEESEARRMCSGDVYRWTTKDDMTFQACEGHIELDDFCRFAEAGDLFSTALEEDRTKIRVKLSDAPEFEAIVLRDNGDGSLYIEDARGQRLVVRKYQVVE